ncbi:MAG TPA: hypothetical protein VI874_00010, partial [Candidatus Norongarragalinales archaeon]|nr:hypothetical protein [Candidatus Norongarragalinales archaeon]
TGSIVDQRVFQDLVQHYVPEEYGLITNLSKIFLPEGESLISCIAFSWFMTLYCGWLPLESSLNVLTHLLTEGRHSVILFQVGLAILRLRKHLLKGKENMPTAKELAKDVFHEELERCIAKEFSHVTYRTIRSARIKHYFELMVHRLQEKNLKPSDYYYFPPPTFDKNTPPSYKEEKDAKTTVKKAIKKDVKTPKRGDAKLSSSSSSSSGTASSPPSGSKPASSNTSPTSTSPTSTSPPTGVSIADRASLSGVKKSGSATRKNFNYDMGSMEDQFKRFQQFIAKTQPKADTPTATNSSAKLIAGASMEAGGTATLRPNSAAKKRRNTHKNGVATLPRNTVIQRVLLIESSSDDEAVPDDVKDMSMDLTLSTSTGLRDSADPDEVNSFLLNQNPQLSTRQRALSNPDLTLLDADDNDSKK